MYKHEFGQSYSRDQIKRNLYKFTLHFFEFYMIYYEFVKFKQFPGI
jgi:hypothetical protein